MSLKGLTNLVKKRSGRLSPSNEEEGREVWQGMSENTTATFLDAADESFGLEDA